MTEAPKPAKPPKFVADMGHGSNRLQGKSKLLSGSVRIKNGVRNRIEFGEDAVFRGTIVIAGHDNVVRIGGNCHYRGDILVKGNGQVVDFGDHSTSVGLHILCQEGCNVRIGRHCMFSREIEVRTTDAHSVIDMVTGNRLNMPEDITIGDHVWVGVGAIINKGSAVPRDSIVGARAFVNSKIREEHTVIAGAPAKVVKRGVTWNRERRDNFSGTEMFEWVTQ